MFLERLNKSPLGPKFLRRDRTLSASDARRVEKTLAAARLLLAVCSVVAVGLDSLEPARYAGLAAGLLNLYALYSLAVFVSLRLQARHPGGFRGTVHALDFLWPALLTTFSSGPNSPLFQLFLFGLMAAAYRWGFWATMISGAAASAILMAEAAVIRMAPGWQLIEGEFELNRFIIRSTYLLVIGFLLGYLAEGEKRGRAEASAISRVTEKLGAERSVRANLESIFGELLHLFDAPRALFAAREKQTGRLFLWSARRSGEGGPGLAQLTEAEAADAPLYLFAPEGHAWYATVPGTPRQASAVLQLDARGTRIATGLSIPAAFLAAWPFRSAIGVSLVIGNEWQSALFLFDPRPGKAREPVLRFLQTLTQRIASAAFNVYLLRRLRSRAGAMERARVARELHDGVLQSLIALEMQVDVLRRKEPGRLAEELNPLQQLLHHEILNVRELMQAMRPVDIEPHQFLDFAADAVERFQRETGISARFVSELDEVWLSPRTARELARILQEALVNVRKHAGARHVVVRFAAELGRWKLWVDDDGRGFDFAGRLEQNQLDQMRRGPAIIKERLRTIQGQLAIESRPGEGARLEISLPQRAYG